MSGRLALVDLAELDAGRLLENLETASTSLGVDEVERSTIQIEPGPVPMACPEPRRSRRPTAT